MLRKFVRQLRPTQEKYVAPVLKIQSLLLAEATGGINIEVLNKTLPKSDVVRSTVLFDAIKNQTPLETTKGKVSINWISDSDRIAAGLGDFSTAFQSTPTRYKSVFVTDKGDKIKLNDILKTKDFGGGAGSGGGAQNTSITECAQCIYAAAVFNGAKLKDGDVLDTSEWGLYNKSFDVDTPLSQVSDELTDDWVSSSILIANQLKTNLGAGSWTFHRGSAFVNRINLIFSKLNKATKPKPFANLNKWSPADIWAAKDGEVFNFESFSTLGEFNNYLKELYDSKKLVGISLKKVVGAVKTEEKNTTGFIKQPVKFNKYTLAKVDFFKSKDVYVYMGNPESEMQLRTFDIRKSWQGEIKGKTASAGKIGGGILESILFQVTKVKFKHDNRKLLSLCTKPTPEFLQELYEMYLGLETKQKIVSKQEFDKLAGGPKVFGKDGPDWRFSKYRGMFYLLQLKSNKQRATQICDNISGYSLSQSDMSAPHVVYK